MESGMPPVSISSNPSAMSSASVAAGAAAGAACGSGDGGGGGGGGGGERGEIFRRVLGWLTGAAGAASGARRRCGKRSLGLWHCMPSMIAFTALNLAAFRTERTGLNFEPGSTVRTRKIHSAPPTLSIWSSDIKYEEIVALARRLALNQNLASVPQFRCPANSALSKYGDHDQGGSIRKCRCSIRDRTGSFERYYFRVAGRIVSLCNGTERRRQILAPETNVSRSATEQRAY